MIRTVWEGKKSAYWTFMAFALSAAIGPTAIFWLVFFVLFSIEGTAFPWLTFLVAPVLIALVLIPIIIWLGVGTYRASNSLSIGHGVAIRLVTGTSIVWAPLAAYLLFGAVLMGLQHYP
jgi:hypothetical protein